MQGKPYHNSIATLGLGFLFSLEFVDQALRESLLAIAVLDQIISVLTKLIGAPYLLCLEYKWI